MKGENMKVVLYSLVIASLTLFYLGRKTTKKVKETVPPVIGVD